MEFEDACPVCGNICSHIELDNFEYIVNCYLCKFSTSFWDYDEYLFFVDQQEERRSKNEVKQRKIDNKGKKVKLID